MNTEVFITHEGEMMGGSTTFAELNRLLDRGYRIHDIQADGMIVLTRDPVATQTRPLDGQETALREVVQFAYQTLYETAEYLPNQADIQNAMAGARAKLRAALFPAEGQ
jgi:hypothetical protein